MAQLALGIVNIVPLAVHSFEAVSSTLNTCRNYSRIVQRIRKAFGIQRRIFENECYLLLRVGLGEHAEAMIANPTHEDWERGQLELEIQTSLKDNYATCIEIMERIVEAINKLEIEFDCFKVGESELQARLRFHQSPSFSPSCLLLPRI